MFVVERKQCQKIVTHHVPRTWIPHMYLSGEGSGWCLCVSVVGWGVGHSCKGKIVKKLMTQGSFIFSGISKRWLLITQLCHIPSQPQVHLRPSLLPIVSFLSLETDIYKDQNLLKEETRSSKKPLQWVNVFGRVYVWFYFYYFPFFFLDLLNLVLNT